MGGGDATGGAKQFVIRHVAACMHDLVDGRGTLLGLAHLRAVGNNGATSQITLAGAVQGRRLIGRRKPGRSVFRGFGVLFRWLRSARDG